MWLWILAAIVGFLVLLDLFLRRGVRCHRVVDDPSLPPTIPTGGDPLWGIVRALWNSLVLKQNAIVGLMQTVQRNDNKLKMLHSTFMGYQMLLTWDPDVAKFVLSHRDDGVFIKDASLVDSFTTLFGKSVFAVDGADWRRQRAVMTPAFHYDRLKRIVPKFCIVADRLVNHWKQYEDGAAVETLPWMSKLTLDALGLGGFGYDLKALEGAADGPYRDYTYVLQEFANPLRIIPFYDKMDSETNRKFKGASKGLTDFLLNIIQERKTKGWEDEDADLLHLLSEAHDVGEGLSDEELVQNLFLFFLAGHETSSTTMNFALYHLAKHQEVQEAAAAEVDRVLQGHHPTFETAKELKYLEAVIKESLRLYPPATGISRKLSVDTEIKGYNVPAGTVVVVISYASQLSEEYFENAQAFRPERFMNEKLKHPFAYMPFGAGARVCIGQYFAMLEMKIALAMLLQNFRFTLTPGHETFQLAMSVTLQTAPGFKITVHKRH